MNKTIYIKDEDGPIWDRARELTHGKLSALIMGDLKAFVLEAEKYACTTCGQPRSVK